MPSVIGVKFRDTGKVYYFDPGDNKIRYHDHVIVETARGIEYGTVVLSPTEISEDKVVQPLRPIVRLATADDTEREKANREREKEAYRVCKQKIQQHGLEMKLIEAEYTFDNSKILFYFTADGRIDFRELVKDLAAIFRTRIELRQIGVRDETKLLGGIGTCGRPLCCHTWLNDFAPVSIKMAKDQNLSLNPTKISGTCGRLMCCLKNEAETYASLNKGLPGKGDYAMTADGQHGDVQSVNILRQTVKVILELENDEKELKEFDVRDLTFIPKAKKLKMREEARAEAERKGRKGKDGQKEPAVAGSGPDDADLEWNPGEGKFDPSDYLIRGNDAGKKERPKKERRKRQPKGSEGAENPSSDSQAARGGNRGGGAEGAGRAGKNAVDDEERASWQGAAERGDKENTGRQRSRRQKSRGDHPQGAERRQNGGTEGAQQNNHRSEGGKPHGEKAPRTGDNAQDAAAAAEGGTKSRKRRRPPRHRGPKADGADANRTPQAMKNSDHYGSDEGE